MLSCGPCEWLAVQGAGYRGACSRAGAGRRVSLACWARAGRRVAAEMDLHFQSRGLFFSTCSIDAELALSVSRLTPQIDS